MTHIDSLTQPFAIAMRDRQLAWALGGGIPVSALEERHGKVSWVLKSECRERNLFRLEWWKYIAGKEHRWARALNSSQCFAVNIFAPLADDPALARKAVQVLLPTRELEPQDTVIVQFEFTPKCAPEWLGERGQPTQVDVYFEVTRLGRCISHVMVEVKFTETGFGCCRGWEAERDETLSNPCLDASAVLSEPQANCWLTKVEGRRYWEIISRPDGSIRPEAIRAEDACPFRHGLYQMMRNRVLADELRRRTEAEWADFAVCRHPDNEALTILDEPVSSMRDAISAFRSLSSNDAVRDWDAREIVETIASTDERLKDWETWMSARYFS